MNWFRRTYIRFRAERILASLMIRRPPVDAQAVAEDLGYKVLFVDFTGKAMYDVLGFSVPSDKTVYVSRASTPREMQMTIAAELGKAVLHDAWWRDETRYRVRRRAGERDREEVESEWFATCLLLPRRWVKDYIEYALKSEMEKLFVADWKDIRNSVTGRPPC